MLEDTRKSLGFGTLLDWRYRQGLKHLCRVDSAATAEEFYAGPDADALLSDPVMANHFFPFVKHRANGIATAGFSPETITAMEMTLAIPHERNATKESISLQLEAGILCGLPEEEVVPDTPELPPLVQFLYEKLFFDVRPFLDDSQTVCRLIFSDPERLARRGSYDLLSKVMAYGLGFWEYSRWRNGSKTKLVKAVQDAMHGLHDYVTGLELLGKDKSEDLVEGYCRLFAMLPDIVASTNGSSEDAKRRHREYLLKQTKGLIGLLAQLPGANSDVASMFGISV